ncbi:MAG: ornithine carbamoyltransferase [Magnetococcales bacterium]|nr:ornithine carbamoyltransferase [Magnetococcales bacterium]MBF0115153.1 ornithine carbamoyltransferase [Magnetococcales bacterium]
MTTHTSTAKRDLLSLVDLSTEEIHYLFARTTHLKAAHKAGEIVHSLRGRTLAMVFEKPSTRTRVSFETGMYQLGGHALFLSSKEMQLGRGEEISDSARVLSRYVDGIMVRTFAHENLVTMAHYATVPVINGLSDDYHPCQILTDIFTFQEHRGSIAGRKVAWIGDGNNVAHSWILAAARLGFHLVLAVPEGYEPKAAIVARAEQEIAQHGTSGSITLVRQPQEAVIAADLVTTDAWTSMGQEQEVKKRQQAFAGYCVDTLLLQHAKPEALFMHCLPAHRGEEVTSEVLDGPQSVVWDEAENRLHVQKAILEWLLA